MQMSFAAARMHIITHVHSQFITPCLVHHEATFRRWKHQAGSNLFPQAMVYALSACHTATKHTAAQAKANCKAALSCERETTSVAALGAYRNALLQACVHIPAGICGRTYAPAMPCLLVFQVGSKQQALPVTWLVSRSLPSPPVQCYSAVHSDSQMQDWAMHSLFSHIQIVAMCSHGKRASAKTETPGNSLAAGTPCKAKEY